MGVTSEGLSLRVIFLRSSLITTTSIAQDWHYRDWIYVAAGRDMGSFGNGGTFANGHMP